MMRDSVAGDTLMPLAFTILAAASCILFTWRMAALFLLRHVEGLSNEELAGMFQLEKNNVAVRLHRIRHRLQAEIER